MTTTTPHAVTAQKRATVVTHAQTFLAMAALMFGVLLAGVALIAAAIALPVALLLRALLGSGAQQRRRGWQPASASA